MKSTLDWIKELTELYQRWEGCVHPGLIYKEGWLLSLVLRWFSEHRDSGYSISMRESAKWYAESKLPSRFMHPPLSEGCTRVSAVYGDIVRGEGDGSDTLVSLTKPYRQLVVISSKMHSMYTKGVTHAPFYDEVSRTLACMCRVIADPRLKPRLRVADMSDISFFTILPDRKKNRTVPQDQSDSFVEYTSIDHIRSTVSRRILERGESSDRLWYEEYFLPLCDHIRIELLTWEEVLSFIKACDPACGTMLSDFYRNCLRYNRGVKP